MPAQISVLMDIVMSQRLHQGEDQGIDRWEKLIPGLYLHNRLVG